MLSWKELLNKFAIFLDWWAIRTWIHLRTNNVVVTLFYVIKWLYLRGYDDISFIIWVFYYGYFYLVRDIKPPILFSPIFSTNFSQFEQLKRKQTFHWSNTEKENLFWTNKNCKNWEKHDWLFDATNKVIVTQDFSVFSCSLMPWKLKLLHLVHKLL